jgi:hypothetical protein
VLLDAILTGRLPLPNPDSNATFEHMRTLQPIDSQSVTLAHFTTDENVLGLYEDAPQPPLTATHDLSPSQILPALTSLLSIQNSLDKAMDTADLRQVIRAALQTTSDAEMLEVLQIGHPEMPDAIKTLQRALEYIRERDDDGVEAPPGNEVAMAKVVKVNFKEVEGPRVPPKRSRTIISTDSSSTSSSGHSLERRRDTLDREFIESGIDCLRRMSRGNETTLPSWTITK